MHVHLQLPITPMETTVMTTWTDDQLHQLSRRANHKIEHDNYEYWWYHRLDNEWSLHCIKSFNEYSKPYSWMKSWLYKWNRELISRDERSTATNRATRIEAYLKDNKTRTHQDAANHFRLSKKTIQRALNQYRY